MRDDSRSRSTPREASAGGRAARRVAASAGATARGIVRTWSLLSPEQRVAGLGALLLIVSTFGPFSFVEASIVLVALAVLVLLRTRALGKDYHLPFGDGTVIAAAGAWCGFLILVRLFERPLGLNLLAIGCAVILLLAGVRERAKRPPDDLPQRRRRERGASADDRADTRESPV